MDEKDKRIKELEEEISRLRYEKDKINQEKEKLEKEFDAFKAKHAGTVENLKKAMKIKSNLKKKPKPLGAPIGHKGYTRHIPARIDKVKELNLRRCPICQSKLGKTQEIRSRCVTDLKLFRGVKTTQYNIHRKYCPKCRMIVEPEVLGVLPHARFGIMIMLLVMYLKLGMRLSCEKVCELLLNVYGLSMSKGEIVHILKKLIIEFGDHYKSLEKVVKQARVKHSDSTSWRINGKNYFVWVFIAYGTVLYKVRKRNNHKVALQLFGKKQNGNILVVDRHSAFRTLAEKTGFLLQLCWSHILEDSKELKRDFGTEGAYVHRKLKEIYAKAVSVRHYCSEELAEQLKGEIIQLVRRHYKHLSIWKFVKSLANRDIDNLFRFVTDPEVDPTNNISERELRSIVLIRKISFGSRSTRGANTTAFLMSIIQTIRLKGKNPLKEMINILDSASGY